MPGINLSENIANKIKHRIIVGEYELGKQLPNEQDLCESLNVSRTTIREAIKLLVSKNILEIERGIGTFVAKVPGLSEDPFGLEFVADEILKTDLCTFRSVVEPEICGFAAKMATDNQIEMMSRQIIKMEDITNRALDCITEEWIDEFIDQEINFHILLYKMSGNIIFERMSDLVARSVIINCTGLKYRRTFDFVKYCDIHTSLYKAIADRDSVKAKEIGLQHCQSFNMFI